MPLIIDPIQQQSRFPLEQKPSLDPALKAIYTDVFSLQNAFKILFLILDNTFQKIADYVNSGGGGVPEAPIDGTIYARKDAAWVHLPAVSGGIPAGSNIIRIAPQSGTNANWRGYTIYAKLEAWQLLCLPNSWKVTLPVKSPGNFSMGPCKVHRTAIGSLAIIDSTAVNYGGTNTPTVTNPTPGTFFDLVSDAIALPLTTDHDHWVMLYFASTNANNNDLAILSATEAVLYYINGDHTADVTIPTGLTTNNYGFSKILAA